MFASRDVSIRANLSYVFAESVAEASPSFPDVELRTFAAWNDANQITGRARDLVLESQLTAQIVESLWRVGMGAGYTAGRPQGKVPDSPSVGPVVWN